MSKYAKQEKVASLIRSRIVGHEEVAPDQLLAHESNYRRHGGAQLDALRGSLSQLGWVKSILVSKRTGKVLDGHARVEEAMRQGLPVVPVEYLDVSEAEEKLILASIDPMSEMAAHDDEALKALLEEVETEEAGLLAMLESIEGKPRPMAQVKVEEVDFSQVADGFWLTVRGPLPRQMAALEKLRAAMEEIPGVEVEVGTNGGWR